MSQYVVTNKSNLPVNLDDLNTVLHPGQSIVLDKLTSHIAELRSNRILVVKKSPNADITATSSTPRRRKSTN